MLEIFVSPLIQVVCEKLASAGLTLLFKQKKYSETSKIVKEWQKKLVLIDAVVSDAQQKQLHNKAVQFWLQQLQDLAYDLEDILDEFATKARYYELIMNNDPFLVEPHTHSFGCLPFTKVPRLSCCAAGAGTSNSKSTDNTTAIQQISLRLKDIMTQAESFSLCPQTRTNSRKDQRKERAETSLVREPVIYGRDDEKAEIIRLCLADDSCSDNYMVISVVGKGGVGKTTLVQSVYNQNGPVYNDEQLNAHFNVKSWVCVSDVFDVKQITTAIIDSIAQQTHSFSDLNQAHVKLKNLLQGKKFLIVLDDIWSDDYDAWDQLQVPFHSSTKGSRVIITTRISKVAKTMLKRPTERSSIMYLKGLSDDNCWRLFQRHAPEDADLINMQNELVGLFKGLPLAAKALGGLLRREDKSQWEKILKSSLWLEQGGVLPVLRLSYYHLPHHLKRVFAYCSIFPKDYHFEETMIVLMWMAEGFLPEDDEESMEEKGHNFILDLVSRSFFEPSPSLQGYFIMHDLIHDLAQQAARDVYVAMDMHKISPATRYFSFTKETLQKQSWTLEHVCQLRTFAFFGGTFHNVPPLQRLDSTFKHFQYLRVLSMTRMGISELPYCIGDLILLRFVDLSNNMKLRLPDSITKLCNLQTLLLKGCGFLKFITNMAHLIELRHLKIAATDLLVMPVGIGKLTKLQTLDRFFLTENSGSRIAELKNLNGLRGSLDISNLQHVVRGEDAAKASLREKLGINVLRMFWGSTTLDVDDNIKRDVLDNLQPPKLIKKLDLFGYNALSFPSWLGDPSFSKITSIKLEVCERCDGLPPLGQLPLLRQLLVRRLLGVKTIGPEFYGVACANPFPSLKSLQFEDMEYWEKWLPSSIEYTKPFPCLETLEILHCPLLQGCLPSHLPSFKRLKITACNEMRVSLPNCPLLEELKISKCKELSSANSVISCSKIIQLIDVSHFTGFTSFRVQGVQSLIVVDEHHLHLREGAQNRLELVNCPKLETWRADEVGDLNNLSHVGLGNYEELAKFLEFNLPSSVRELRIHGYNSLKHISTFTKRCNSLEVLFIEKCESLIEVDDLPLTLQMLQFYDVHIKQLARHWKLSLLTSLKNLELHNAGSSVYSVESIPGPDLNLPSSLTFMSIKGFPNLKSVSCSRLPNLVHIQISMCPKLVSLGANFPPQHLRGVSITDCPLMEQHCKPDYNGLITIWQDSEMMRRYSYVDHENLPLAIV